MLFRSIIIDSTGMKGIGKTGSDSNIVWIVELDEREEQGGGGGIRLKTRPMTFHIDYAFVDYGILKLSHQVGLGLEF